MISARAHVGREPKHDFFSVLPSKCRRFCTDMEFYNSSWSNLTPSFLVLWVLYLAKGLTMINSNSLVCLRLKSMAMMNQS